MAKVIRLEVTRHDGDVDLYTGSKEAHFITNVDASGGLSIVGMSDAFPLPRTYIQEIYYCNGQWRKYHAMFDGTP